MIIDEKTIAVLANFQRINQNLIIRPGNTLRTISASDSLMAQASVPFVFHDEFYIYDLSKLLAILSLSKESDISKEDKDLVIKQGKSKIRYRLADPVLFKEVSTGDIVIPEPDIEFSLPWSVLASVMKALQILKVNELAFSGDGQKLMISSYNLRDKDDNSYSTEIGETYKVFNCIIELEKLKLMESDYYVKITKKGLVHFKGDNIDYYVAFNNQSRFEDEE